MKDGSFFIRVWMEETRFEARPRPQFQANRFYRPGSVDIQRPGVSKSRATEVISPCTNVFINYIPSEFRENDLRKLCSCFGKIIASKIMINLDTGQSKCFGFVRFETLEQAGNAIKHLNGMEVGNKKLLAKYAESQEKKEKASVTVYVKRLPMCIGEHDVRQLFSRFGEIVDTAPHCIETLEPQYWRCFVTYRDYKSAQTAIDTMNNVIVANGTRPIHVRYADESKMSQNMFTGPTGPMVARRDVNITRRSYGPQTVNPMGMSGHTSLPAMTDLFAPMSMSMGEEALDSADPMRLLPSFLLQE